MVSVKIQGLHTRKPLNNRIVDFIPVTGWILFMQAVVGCFVIGFWSTISIDEDQVTIGRFSWIHLSQK
jgi:hypothetical protein